MGLLSWLGGGRPWAAPQASPAGAGPTPPPGWSELPAMQRTMSPMGLVIDPTGFRDSLATWANPSFTGQLGHLVSPEAPSGLAHGLAGPGQPVVSRHAETSATASEGRAAVIRQFAEWRVGGAPAAPVARLQRLAAEPLTSARPLQTAETARQLASLLTVVEPPEPDTVTASDPVAPAAVSASPAPVQRSSASDIPVARPRALGLGEPLPALPPTAQAKPAARTSTPLAPEPGVPEGPADSGSQPVVARVSEPDEPAAPAPATMPLLGHASPEPHTPGNTGSAPEAGRSTPKDEPPAQPSSRPAQLQRATAPPPMPEPGGGPPTAVPELPVTPPAPAAPPLGDDPVESRPFQAVEGVAAASTHDSSVPASAEVAATEQARPLLGGNVLEVHPDSATHHPETGPGRPEPEQPPAVQQQPVQLQRAPETPAMAGSTGDSAPVQPQEAAAPPPSAPLLGDNHIQAHADSALEPPEPRSASEPVPPQRESAGGAPAPGQRAVPAQATELVVPLVAQRSMQLLSHVPAPADDGPGPLPGPPVPAAPVVPARWSSPGEPGGGSGSLGRQQPTPVTPGPPASSGAVPVQRSVALTTPSRPLTATPAARATRVSGPDMAGSPAGGVVDAGSVAVAAGVAQRMADGSVVFRRPQVQRDGGTPPEATQQSEPSPEPLPEGSTPSQPPPAGPETGPETGPEAGPPAGADTAAAAAAGAAGGSTGAGTPKVTDELVRALFAPLSRMLKTELRLERERAGFLINLRH